MNVVTQPADFAGSTILIAFEGKKKQISREFH